MKIFDEVQKIQIPRTMFDLSHQHLTTGQMGKLMPLACFETLPGETFKIATQQYLRFMPMTSPLQAKIDVSLHWFYVSTPQIWPEFDDFIRGGESGADVIATPKIVLSDAMSSDFVKRGELADYLRFPTLKDEQNLGTEINKISALPFRAYQHIFNHYYRDENLQAKVDFALTSGDLTVEEAEKIMAIKWRNWTKDYFTSALSEPQKGEQVYLPMQGTAPVEGTLSGTTENDNAWTQSDGDPIETNGTDDLGVDENGRIVHKFDVTGQEVIRHKHPLAAEFEGVANLEEATSIAVDDVIEAFALQKLFKLQAQAGNRYDEWILANYGAYVPAGRMQEPEYLGGHKQPCIISEVMQTSQTTETSLLGTPSGKMISAGEGDFIYYKAPEHGFIMCIASIMPQPLYCNGLSRMWTRDDRFDYHMPIFNNLGEQPVLQEELYWQHTETQDNKSTWAYQAKSNEYRFIPSHISGDMKTIMKNWHMGRIFDGLPGLNDSFISTKDTIRKDCFVLANDQYDECIMDVGFYIKALRPMPLIPIQSIQ